MEPSFETDEEAKRWYLKVFIISFAGHLFLTGLFAAALLWALNGSFWGWLAFGFLCWLGGPPWLVTTQTTPFQFSLLKRVLQSDNAKELVERINLINESGATIMRGPAQLRAIFADVR